MSSNFFSLPREIRDQIYEPVLLHQEPINPWVDDNRQQKLSPGLLRANKTVHREASSLFYARNRFDFTMGTPDDIASFLGQIGRSNVDYIRHINVEFPRFLHLNPGDVALEDESVGILANIQSSCTGLKTLTTPMDSTDAMVVKLAALVHPQVVTEALRLVNIHFRAIPSLQGIIVEAYEDGLIDHIRLEMESHGWTIRTREYAQKKSLDDFFENHGPCCDSDDEDDGSYRIRPSPCLILRSFV
ncbi:MAG: hypothetical protein Q9208_002899 [Pyrenodesmia sp. 3 TL-2023]